MRFEFLNIARAALPASSGWTNDDHKDLIQDFFVALLVLRDEGIYREKPAEELEKIIGGIFGNCLKRFIDARHPKKKPGDAEKEALRRTLLWTPDDEIDPEAKARWKAEERTSAPKEIKSLAQLDWSGKWSSPVLTAIFLALHQLDAGHISLAEAQYTVAAILAEAKLTPSLQRLAGDSVRYSHFIGGKTIEQIAIERHLSPREVRELTRKVRLALRVQVEGIALFNRALEKAHRERPSLL